MKPIGHPSPAPSDRRRAPGHSRPRGSASLASAPTLPGQPDLDDLLARIRACRVCASSLPLGPRPVVQAGPTARLLIVGQAPSARVHASGVPWDDASGRRLRDWLALDAARFYDPGAVAIVPMGYCYPGRGGGGDRPPRRECAELWLPALLARLPAVELTLLIGGYAQRHFLGTARKAGLTETVAAFAEYAPGYLPLPHPSPRNTAWLQRNRWFEDRLLPHVRRRVQATLGAPCGVAP